MGSYTSNAAFAYDMQSTSSAFEGSAARQLSPQAPQAPARPKLGVLTGAGREASQAVSPVFLHVAQVACVLVILFAAVAVGRVFIASSCASMLNANATLANTLESEQEQSAELEVMHSVFGSSTRIRDIAEDSLGMVESTGGVTIDLGSAQATE